MHHHMPPDHAMPPPFPRFLGIDLPILAYNTSLIAFYYFNSFFLIPMLLGSRRRIWYSLSVIACMIIVVASPAIVASLSPSHDMGVDMENHRQMAGIRILVTTLVFAIIYIISTGSRLVKEWYSAEQETKQILLEKTTAELSFLKAQINPHFLFNTLNNIYSLSVKRSDQTPEAVLLLADMMRYVLSDAQNNHVPVESETNYLSKFIELQKIRLTNKVTIEYNVTGDVNSNIIAPMILVPFIENAFKFGISTHEPSTITILIDVKGHTLKMKAANRVFPTSHLIAKSSGIGLINVKRRLSLLYPDRYRLKIDPNKDGNYIVELEINLSV
jgi:sensor histidine kinase YesM